MLTYHDLLLRSRFFLQKSRMYTKNNDEERKYSGIPYMQLVFIEHIFLMTFQKMFISFATFRKLFSTEIEPEVVTKISLQEQIVPIKNYLTSIFNPANRKFPFFHKAFLSLPTASVQVLRNRWSAIHSRTMIFSFRAHNYVFCSVVGLFISASFHGK